MGSDEVLHCFGGNWEETGGGALVLHCFGTSRIMLDDSPLGERGRDRRWWEESKRPARKTRRNERWWCVVIDYVC